VGGRVCVYLLLAGKTHATWQMDATLGEIVSMWCKTWSKLSSSQITVECQCHGDHMLACWRSRL